MSDSWQQVKTSLSLLLPLVGYYLDKNHLEPENISYSFQAKNKVLTMIYVTQKSCYLENLVNQKFFKCYFSDIYLINIIFQY